MATDSGSNSFLANRVDRAALPLAVGDLLVIVAFIYAGTIQHGTVPFPLAGAGDAVALLAVAAPFLLGWVVAAPLVGAYSAGAAESAKASVPLAVRSWIPAAAVGLILRATPLVDGGVAVTFAVVMLVVGSVSLAVWRYVAGQFL
ncbi:DUF3054 domain-containing protein [Halobaculum sp. CBA1158]|uniref:DUF3054 domain-containing protein n=1 Tax=Halobaculum sp. CBA1158 TaxID=2904243 RepID=UPI001F20D375|nr:DUF3054 domain-containing protein [Halobaculum sp. CBA1158]UIO98739.1 DUF3054 domain-containing protein [Halobaculum sp. CBA1158]